MPLFVAVYAACDVPLSGSWPAALSVRYARASLRSARYARLHLLTVVAQLFAAINDALAPWLHVPLPFLLDLGFDVSVLSLGYVLMRRWRDDMEHIDALSAQL